MDGQGTILEGREGRDRRGNDQGQPHQGKHLSDLEGRHGSRLRILLYGQVQGKQLGRTVPQSTGWQA